MNPRTCCYCRSLIDPEAFCAACQAAKAGGGAPFECILHGKVARAHPSRRYCTVRCREAFWKERSRLGLTAHVRPCKRTLRLL